MLKDTSGNRLFKKVTVKVVYPEAIFPPKTFVQRAGPKQGFNPEGIEGILMQVATRLDELYPWWNFKHVELSPEGRTARFVFTFVGYNSMPAPPMEIPEFANINPQE